MLFNVYEASHVLGIPAFRLYYELEMCRIDGAFKVLNVWRIDECIMEELYARYSKRDDRGASCDSGFQGFAERLAAVRAKCVADAGRSCLACLQDGRGAVRGKGGSHRLAGREERALADGQLEFDFSI